MSNQGKIMSEVLDVSPTPEEIEAFDQEQQIPSPEQTPPVDSQAPSKEEQKQIENMVKEFKLKVNGKEIVEKVDLSDEKRLIKALQMEKLATEAAQKASAKEKDLEAMNAQLDQFFTLLKENPLAVLLNPELGLNAEELANQILTMQAEEDSKSPEQKALEQERQAKEELLRKIAELERKEQEKIQEAERLKEAKIVEDFEREVTSAISNAIESGDLPESPYITAKFGQLLKVAFDNELDVNPADLIPVVKEAYMRDMRAMIGKLPDEIIEDMVTPERIKGIRNKKVQALREATMKTNNSLKSVEEGSRKPTNEEKKRSGNFFKTLGEW